MSIDLLCSCRKYPYLLNRRDFIPRYPTPLEIPIIVKDVCTHCNCASFLYTTFMNVTTSCHFNTGIKYAQSNCVQHNLQKPRAANKGHNPEHLVWWALHVTDEFTYCWMIQSTQKEASLLRVWRSRLQVNQNVMRALYKSVFNGPTWLSVCSFVKAINGFNNSNLIPRVSHLTAWGRGGWTRVKLHYGKGN